MTYTYTFEVTEDNGVKGYATDADGNKQILINQPTWASGEPFTAKQAKAYGEAWVNSFADDATELPGNSPEEPTLPKVVVVAEVVEEPLAITE